MDVVGSGEHEARQQLIGKTVINVVYQINRGVETMWIELDNGDVFTITPEANHGAADETVHYIHLKHSIHNELVGDSQ